jgi:hypothetical protein
MGNREWINLTDSEEALIPRRILSVLAEFKARVKWKPSGQTNALGQEIGANKCKLIT